MFVRLKKTGDYKYLQIVQTYREGRKVKQRVISTLAGWSSYRKREI
jgi:hypothetical protein